MTGRDTVVRAVRRALTDVPRTESPDDAPSSPGHRTDQAVPDIVGLFGERTAEYRATVVRVPVARAAVAVRDALVRTGARSLVVPPGLPADLIPQGPWSRLEDSPPLTPGQLDAADAVLTTAATAIAVTGTVILDHGPGQGRRALTLLPDQHICLVREDQIVFDVPDALGRIDPYRPLTLVSGPSATSDIELDRVEGVHGPRTLDIIVIGET
ncbi:LUD domain-containing protein [Streptomyces sp. S.PNR 29]|uniref:LutC/YkgG family protein n=1 Tax=Streptomyces sp. S.PNR 29 TaxID=2973805 RepID=UPI0025B16943|nr:LUD domain-containing protein [Streptomyces sp. S.PNR 29]MDN0198888.1 LUD domain-containing protein [Streptomyces sp. S.PNR 29]